MATRKHFARLFQKYSSPLCVLNLTKATNPREETVAAEYRNFCKISLNSELPDALKVNFLHYDVKMKKKRVKNFPFDLFAHVKDFLDMTGFFSCVPCARMPFDPSKPDRLTKRDLCRV